MKAIVTVISIFLLASNTAFCKESHDAERVYLEYLKAADDQDLDKWMIYMSSGMKSHVQEFVDKVNAHNEPVYYETIDAKTAYGKKHFMHTRPQVKIFHPESHPKKVKVLKVIDRGDHAYVQLKGIVNDKKSVGEAKLIKEGNDWKVDKDPMWREVLDSPHSKSYWKSRIKKLKIGDSLGQVVELLPVKYGLKSHHTEKENVMEYWVDAGWKIIIKHDSHGSSQKHIQNKENRLLETPTLLKEKAPEIKFYSEKDEIH